MASADPVFLAVSSQVT